MTALKEFLHRIDVIGEWAPAVATWLLWAFLFWCAACWAGRKTAAMYDRVRRRGRSRYRILYEAYSQGIKVLAQSPRLDWTEKRRVLWQLREQIDCLIQRGDAGKSESAELEAARDDRERKLAAFRAADAACKEAKKT